jgi:hypothetical protein
LADKGIPLRDFVAGLREELRAAHEDAEAASADSDQVRFTVGPVNVEFTLAATRELDGKGGVKFYVFELGGGGSTSTTSTQRVSLTLTPTTGDGSPLNVSDDSLKRTPQ